MRRTLLLLSALAAAFAATACGPPDAPAGDGQALQTSTASATGVVGTVAPTTTTAPRTTSSESTAAPTAVASAGGGGVGGGPVAEDCITYDAQVLRKRYEAGIHVVFVEGGPDLLRLYGGPSDVVGDRALAVARRFTTVCFIGRGNVLGSPEYIFEYWKNPSEFDGSPIPYGGDQCFTYDPTHLRVDYMGVGLGWRISDDAHALQAFATQADLDQGRDIITAQNHICYIANSTPEMVPNHISYTLAFGD